MFGYAEARQLERRFLLVYIALFFPYSIMTPFMQQLLHLYGYTPAQIGYILGALELTAVLAPPVWGMLSDRQRAPRGVLLLTILLSIPTLRLIQPGLSTMPALLAAIAFGFFNKPSIPLTDGVTFAAFRQTQAQYGRVRVGGTIAFVASMLCCEFVFHVGDDATGKRIVLFLSGMLLIQALSLALIPRTANSTSATPQATTTAFPWGMALRGGFPLFVLSAFLARFAMMSYYSFFSRYLNEVVGCTAIGYVWMLGPISEFPVIFWSGPIISRIGLKRLFMLALAGTVLRLFGFALGSSLVVVLLLQPLHALTFGAYHVAGVSWIGRLFPKEFQSTAQTIYSALTTGLGGLLGSAFAGVIVQHYGYTAMYLTCGCIALLAMLLALPVSEVATPLPPSTQTTKARLCS